MRNGDNHMIMGLSSGRRLGAAFVACLILAACDGGTGPVDESQDAAGAEAIATFLVDFNPMGVGIRGSSTPGTYTYTRTSACPAGGSQTATGSTTSTLNATTNVLSATWTTTQTHDKCAFSHTRGGATVKTVIDGKVTVTGASTTQLSVGRTAPARLLTHASTTKGSTTTTVGETARVCAMDFTETYNPAANTYTIKGVVCGQQVTITRTPGQGTGTRG